MLVGLCALTSSKCIISIWYFEILKCLPNFIKFLGERWTAVLNNVDLSHVLYSLQMFLKSISLSIHTHTHYINVFIIYMFFSCQYLPLPFVLYIMLYYFTYLAPGSICIHNPQLDLFMFLETSFCSSLIQFQ